MRKKILLSFLLTLNSTLLLSQSSTYTILLTGASFADAGNGWFEIGCKKINATPINKAIGGEAIANTANRMIEGTLYSKHELEIIDAFVIMHVHNQDVFNSPGLKNDYTEYNIPFDRSDYAAAFDYVIKKYMTDCYNLKNDSTSVYYNTKHGKPALIILCTDWHDGRTLYNSSVRKLSEKWGFPLVEFDKFIGFSKNQLHPVTKKQHSLIYSSDSQVINEETFGWHPLRGKNSPIQLKMGAIFSDLIKKTLISSTNE